MRNSSQEWDLARSFTPAQTYLRVTFSATSSFTLAAITLKGIDVDTITTTIPARQLSYRYGFNSMEKDDQIIGKGEGWSGGISGTDGKDDYHIHSFGVSAGKAGGWWSGSTTTSW